MTAPLANMIEKIAATVVKNWWRDFGMTLTWAIVTDDAPLRVRPSSQADPIEVTPESLTPGLVVGDRVLVIRFGSASVVLGKIPEPVVQTGSNANGWWEKHDTGLLICRHSRDFSVSGSGQWTWTYPVAFVGSVPWVGATAATAVPENVDLGYTETGTPLTTVNVEYYRTSSTTTPVNLVAIGRWK